MSNANINGFLSSVNNDKIKVWQSKGFLDNLPQKFTIKDIVDNHENIYKHLTTNYSNKGTLKTNVSLLSKLMRLYNKHEEHDFYKKVIQELQNGIIKVKKDNIPDKNFLTSDEIKNKIDFYSKLQFKDLSNNYYHLILSLYYYNPPLRNDYINIEIYDKKIRKLDNKELTNKNKNFYANYKGKGYFIINTDKVSGKVGRGLITIGDKLNEIIKKSLEYRPRKYLLTKINNVLEPLYDSAIIEILHRIFQKNISIKHLRQAYINSHYIDGVTENEIEKIATDMRHTPQTARIFYKKV